VADVDNDHSHAVQGEFEASSHIFVIAVPAIARVEEPAEFQFDKLDYTPSQGDELDSGAEFHRAGHIASMTRLRSEDDQ